MPVKMNEAQNEEVIELPLPDVELVTLYDTYDEVSTIADYTGTRGLPWGHESMNVEKAWEVTKGEGIIIGVLDTGCDVNHPDLVGKIIDGYNVVDDTTDITDNNGHGTHVVGTIAANGTQFKGIAPEAKIVVGKIAISDTNSSAYASDQAKGFDYLTNWRGPNGEKVDVINMSYDTLPEEIIRAAIERAVKAGIHVVIASGNNGDMNSNTLEYNWATFQYGVSTSARGNKSDGTSRNGVNNSSLDVTTPGENIISCEPGGGYAVKSGSSMAAPHLVGAIALIKSAFRKNGIELSFKEVEDIIKKFFIKPPTALIKEPTRTGYGTFDFSQNKLPKPNTLKPKKKGEVLYPPISASASGAYYALGLNKVWKHSTGEGKVIAFIGPGVTPMALLNNTIIDGRNFTAENGGIATDYSSTVLNMNKAIGVAIGGKSVTSGVIYHEVVGAAYNAKALVLKAMNNDLTFDPNNFTLALKYAFDWVGPNGEKVDAVVLPTTWDKSATDFDFSAFRTAYLPYFNRDISIFVPPPTSSSAMFPVEDWDIAFPVSHISAGNANGFSPYSSSVSYISTSGTSIESDNYICSLPTNWLPNITGATTTTSTALTSEYTAAVMAGDFVCLKGWYEQAGIEIDTAIKSLRSFWKLEIQKYTEPWPNINKKFAGWGRVNFAYNELPEIFTPTEMMLSINNSSSDSAPTVSTSLTKYIENGVPKVSTSRTSFKNKVANKFN